MGVELRPVTVDGLRGGAAGADGRSACSTVLEYVQPRVTRPTSRPAPGFKAELAGQIFAVALGPPPGSRPEPAADGYRYDAYVSFAPVEPDATWVWKTSVPRLRAGGLRVAVSGDVEEGGVDRVVSVERGVEQSRRIVLVLSPAYLSDNDGALVESLGQAINFQTGAYRLLPVVIARYPLPLRLSRLVARDLTVPARAERIRPPAARPEGAAAAPLTETPMSNTPPPFFADIPVLGARSPTEVAEALRAMDDPDAERATVAAAGATTRGGLAELFGRAAPKAWQHTAHQLGFDRPRPARQPGPAPGRPSGRDPGRPGCDARINIHLDRLHVHEYPGGGRTCAWSQSGPRTRGRRYGAGELRPGVPRAGRAVGRRHRLPAVPRTGRRPDGGGVPVLHGERQGHGGRGDAAVLESPAFTAGLNLLTHRPAGRSSHSRT